MAPNINAMDQDTQSGNPDIQPVVPGNINQVVSMLNRNREAKRDTKDRGKLFRDFLATTSENPNTPRHRNAVLNEMSAGNANPNTLGSIG